MSQDLEHQELLTLYQITVSDLSYFKSQQWAVSTYAFLLYAGLAGVREMAGPALETIEKAVLTSFVLAVLLAALAIIKKLKDSIDVREYRLEATRRHFGQKFQDAWHAKSKGKEYVRSVWFLNAAVIFGAVVISYSIWQLPAYIEFP